MLRRLRVVLVVLILVRRLNVMWLWIVLSRGLWLLAVLRRWLLTLLLICDCGVALASGLDVSLEFADVMFYAVEFYD